MRGVGHRWFCEAMLERHEEEALAWKEAQFVSDTWTFKNIQHFVQLKRYKQVSTIPTSSLIALLVSSYCSTSFQDSDNMLQVKT